MSKSWKQRQWPVSEHTAIRFEVKEREFVEARAFVAGFWGN